MVVLSTKQQPPGRKKETWVKKLQFLQWPLEAVSKGESILIETHIKMTKFTAWYKLVIIDFPFI